MLDAVLGMPAAAAGAATASVATPRAAGGHGPYCGPRGHLLPLLRA